MLVLSRRRREFITITAPDGTKARVIILSHGSQVRVGVEAPKNWQVLRGEVTDKGGSKCNI